MKIKNLAKDRKLKCFIVALAMSLWGFNCYAQDPRNLIELESELCGAQNAAQHNTSIIQGLIESNVLIKIPPGQYLMDPIVISGISNGKIMGTGGLDTILEFTNVEGLKLRNVIDFELEGLQIGSPYDSGVVVLEEGGNLTAKTVGIIYSNSASDMCLVVPSQKSLDWLVPVLFILL